MEGFAQVPVPQQTSTPDLTKPPEWMRKRAGASFGFGGKLITFENDKSAPAAAIQAAQPGQPVLPIHRTVRISQVITEPVLVQKSTDFEKLLEDDNDRNLAEYCSNKAEEASDQHIKYIWQFLQAYFDFFSQDKMLNLLGYNKEEIYPKWLQLVDEKFIDLDLYKTSDTQLSGLEDDLSKVTRIDDDESNDPPAAIAQNQVKAVTPFKIKTGDDIEAHITKALLMKDANVAVGLCCKANRFADALILAQGDSDLLTTTVNEYLEQSEGCISSLISATISSFISAPVSNRCWFIINNCEVASWKEALAFILTHPSDNDLPRLCEQLAKRLEKESQADPKLAQDAQICYICGGNFKKLISSLTKNGIKSTTQLQELVELVIFLYKVLVERRRVQFEVTSITLENAKCAAAAAVQTAQPGQPVLPIQKSTKLEKLLEDEGNEYFGVYCSNKADEVSDQHIKYIWQFLQAYFDVFSKDEMLELLGYNKLEIYPKWLQLVDEKFLEDLDIYRTSDTQLSCLEDDLSRMDDDESNDPLPAIAQNQVKAVTPFKIKTGDDIEAHITKALLMKDINVAVGLCCKANRFADALILAQGDSDLLTTTVNKYLEQSEGCISSLISATVLNDFGIIINNCEVASWKEALAFIITHASDKDHPRLCEQLAKRLEEESQADPKLAQDAQICYICAGSFKKLISSLTKKSTTQCPELVNFLYKVLVEWRRVQVPDGLADLLSHYASLLASQGSLTTAVTYLDLTRNEKVSMLRDRLDVALGRKPSNAQEIRQQQKRRRRSSGSSSTAYILDSSIASSDGNLTKKLKTETPNILSDLHQAIQLLQNGCLD